MNPMVQLNGNVSSKVFAAIVGPLVALLIALAGLLIGRETAATEVKTGLRSHERLGGHPVMVERVNGLDRELSGRLDRIEEKLDQKATDDQAIYDQVLLRLSRIEAGM